MMFSSQHLRRTLLLKQKYKCKSKLIHDKRIDVFSSALDKNAPLKTKNMDAKRVGGVGLN